MADWCHMDEKAVLAELRSDKKGLTEAEAQKRLGMYGENVLKEKERPQWWQVFLAQFDAIKKIAEEGPCILVGRCADYALEGYDNVLSLFIHANLDARIRRIARLYDLTDAKAKERILKTDKQRSSYYNYYSNKKWSSADSYDICLDSSVLGIDGTAEAIIKLVEIKERDTSKRL